MLAPFTIFAQVEIAPRVNYNAILEPSAGIIHGAGQSKEAFKEYSNALPVKPTMYMTYIGLKGIKSTHYFKLLDSIAKYFNNPEMIFQIGFSMTNDGSPTEHYEHEVAKGMYDMQLDTFLKGLQMFAYPVLIRIGYEFNGPWNGYKDSTYKEAFRYVTTRIRSLDKKDIATVWCFAPDERTPNFMAYYPGDEFVDWWGIDLFKPNDFVMAESHRFMEQSIQHKKPVIIGETTPRTVGVHQGDTSWINWYQPYFNIISNYPNIKAVSYINWNWAHYPMWANWGDARIQANPIINEKYSKAMQHPLFIHAK